MSDLILMRYRYFSNLKWFIGYLIIQQIEEWGYYVVPGNRKQQWWLPRFRSDEGFTGTPVNGT